MATINFKYTLEPYSGMKTRYECPNCNKKGVFTKYIDTNSNKPISDLVGCCNRLLKCGYHYKPKQYFNDNKISYDPKNNTKARAIIKFKPKPIISFIDVDILRKSQTNKFPNYFIDYLVHLWDFDVAVYLLNKYNIGTSKHWKGATVFWQVDINNKIRTGKIMLYNASTGKRVKNPYNHINWAHNALKFNNFNLKQCFFGEHLLNEDKNKPVAIVESEKTAIIASIYLPEFIWLACGSANNLNNDKTKVLKGRNVILFPDLNCYDLWNDKIPQLTCMATFRTSTLLKDKATESEKDRGLDIADYLIRL